MSIFRFLSWSRKPSRRSSRRPSRHQARLCVETLEARFVPATTASYTISGYVFNDVNNNGLFNVGDPPIANTSLQLLNSSGQVVNSATSDNTGFYLFANDNTVSMTPQSVTQTLNFPATQTDFTLQEALNQFNPSLGQLQSVVISQAGSITSTIKVENTSPSSGATINATVSGVMTLTGPGVSSPLTLQQNAGTFSATSYDGTLDFGGTSGTSFAPQTASGTDQLTLTGAQLTAFEGTGTVNLSEAGRATSSATGGGNLVVSLVSSGQATVTVTYNYIPSNALKPGNYTIVLTQTPPGYFPGKESSNGVVLNVPPGTNSIPVTLTNSNAPNNDFGELLPSSLSGFVYVDANRNGIKDSGDNGLPGIQITLSGTDDTGAPVSQNAFTDPTGAYSFNNLRPGNYTLTEAQPSGYIIGKDTAGSQGGTGGNGQITGINLAQNIQGINNNFGEVVPSSDLAVTKAANHTQVQVGQEVDYTLTVKNLGPDPAQNVLVTDTLPPGVTFLSASSPGWTVTQNNGVVTATINSLAKGVTDVIDVAVDAPLVPGNITNTVVVSSDTPDSNPSNNTASVTTSVIDVPAKVFPKAIPPLVTTPAIFSKLQLVPALRYLLNQNEINQLATIDGLYRTLTGQPATYSQQLNAYQQLQNGSMSWDSLVNTLWASNAHMNLEARSLYKEVLQRAPLAAELASTVASLRAGASESDIMLTLLTSSEYQAKHPTAASFINGFYLNVLGEIPSSLTQLTLVQALGAETIQQEAQSLLQSTDGVNGIVTSGFDSILRRAPTSSELQYWSNQLQSGAVTQDAFLHQLLVSSQFQQLCVNRIQQY